MEKILSRYGYIAADHRQREENGDVVMRKDEFIRSELERLQLAIERLKGKELEGMSFLDLVSLESLLNDSLLSVKDQKTILLNQVERARLQVRTRLLLELCFICLYALPGEKNIGREPTLRKQIESMVGRGSSGAQVEPDSSSSDDDNENENEEHHSDTSLQLGWGKRKKRKKLKIKPPSDNSGSQVFSD